MMAQSARDPLFYACLTIANQDAAFAGDICLRCHTPGGWLSGRSTPTDGSSLSSLDLDGVSCSVCHRMVDPVFKPGVSPPRDEAIIAAINPPPLVPGSGNFVMDPVDVRRGPYADLQGVNPGHLWSPSPFHRSPELCGTCHDVSNPLYERQPDDTYVLGPLNQAHNPEQNQYRMFPLERTYSEWLHSDFAKRGVDMGARYGAQQVVSTCQDCHMPVASGKGCSFGVSRDDLRGHDFAGGNAWVQDMILNLYPDSGLNTEYLHEGKERAVSMLRRACSLELSQEGNQVNVRVVNETGHKLPTGYPEGRRMWINVQVLDEELDVIREYGHYDGATADLAVYDTKVYEIKLGLDAAVAALVNLPVGESFHFALNNVVVKDNRIPPRGFTNAAYRNVQAMPVAERYDDGQYWDDSRFRLPLGAHSIRVSVHYQTASKEYVTFLRDENRTNDDGQVLYDQWELTEKSPPVEMSDATIAIMPFAGGDADGDGRIDGADYGGFATCMTPPMAGSIDLDCVEFDFDADGDVDLYDFGQLQQAFSD